MQKIVPITILTGFLGAGKTTLLNKIVNHNSNLKFGLLINENGDIPIDSQTITSSGQEIIEITNGCVCCVVRGDLIKAVDTLLTQGGVDYIIIEASGMSEPKLIANTFVANDMEGRIRLDGIVCLVDLINFELTTDSYQTAIDQVQYSDIIVLNKAQEVSLEQIKKHQKMIAELNPQVSVLINNQDIQTNLLIDTGKWSDDKLLDIHNQEHNHNHEHNHDNHEHHNHTEHEHNEVDEVVFVSDTNQFLNPHRLDAWLQSKFPTNCIRAKGILRIKIEDKIGVYLFQMVGASKTLIPFETTRNDVKLDFSRMVLIGKNLDKDQILADLTACIN